MLGKRILMKRSCSLEGEEGNDCPLKLTLCPGRMATMGHREAAELLGRGSLGDHRREEPLNGMTCMALL